MADLDGPVVPGGHLAVLVLRAVRWRLPLLLVVAVSLSWAGLQELGRQPDVYEAVAVVTVAPRPGEIASSDLLRLSAQRLAVGLGSEDTLAGVAERAGVSASDIETRVEVTVPTDTANVRIVVRMESAEEAAKVANLLGEAGRSRWAADRLVSVALTSPAAVPAHPAWPPRTLLTVLIVLLGIGSGLGTAVLAERVGPRLRTRSDVEATTGVPVLGWVPRGGGQPSGTLTAALEREPLGSAIRSLRTRFLARSTGGGDLRSVAVSGVGPSSARTWITTLLSVALARSGHPTGLVLADRSTTTSRVLDRVGDEPPVGEDERQDGDPASGTCRRVVEDRLLVLSPSDEQWGSDALALAMPKLIVEAGQSADVVIVDAPPLVEDIARSAVVASVDAALLVVPRGCRAASVRTAVATLEALGTPLLGTVVSRGGWRARAVRHQQPRTRRARRRADRRRTADGTAGGPADLVADGTRDA